jgi:hypothetical protein
VSDSYGSGTDHPDVETFGSGGGPRADPLIPCNDCGDEERCSTMKRRDDWNLTYLDDGSGQWVAYCPECDRDV